MDRGVIAAAGELFDARHFPGVVALASNALEEEPECVPLLVVRARAHIALRRDLDAQADLRDIIRLDPRCGLAYRLLGELAARRDEHESAAIFFREALRLDDDDREAREWLSIVDPTTRRRSPARTDRPSSQPRFARGTEAPDEEPTQPFQQPLFARGSRPNAVWTEDRGEPAPLPPTPIVPPRARAMSRGPVPELPGFGEYLVSIGILTRERLRAAQAYQRSMRVQLATAVITLGLATPQRIEWAAVAHQSHLGRQRT